MDPGVEIEAKFNVSDLDEIRRRLVNRGARIIVPRHLEHNLYFDTPNRHLRSSRKILRIRTGTHSRMTLKHQTTSFEARIEIELALDDPPEARTFLQALGYEVILSYSKMRETFEIDDVHAMLDELPVGRFIEIEGPTMDRVKVVSTKLGLDWEKRSKVGYLTLLERACELLSIATHEIPFEAEHPLNSIDLGLDDATMTEISNRIKS